jgi:diphosphomevalonate decarboxylase
MSNKTVEIGWKAPANIALIKYWGKREEQLPENGSMSFSLDRSITTTCISFREKLHATDELSMEYHFHGQRHPAFEGKTAKLLHRLKLEMPFLGDYLLVIASENSFPHSAGIASSASSMAALALCLTSMEEWISGFKMSKEDFYRRASGIARLGSGSASRSVYGGMVTWGEISSIANSSDLFASPFPLPKQSRLKQLRDIILVVSSKEKPVSSSAGHAKMVDHPYREGRKLQANSNLARMTAAIAANNYRLIAEIAENEALSLHALLMTSLPDGLLLQPNTLGIVAEIRLFRESTGMDLFFTIDAGPNVHLIYYEEQRKQVVQFVQDRLLRYCENGQWIDDKIGAGPMLITPEIVY